MKADPASLKAIEAALAAGTATVTAGPALPPKGGGKARPPALVEAGFARAGEAAVFTVPVVTVSEANQREWRGRSARTGLQRRAVSKVLGRHLAELVPFAEHYHGGGRLGVRLVRLGGRPMDRLANLGASLKAVEDMVALAVGADDGDPRWLAWADQEPGGPAGVRIVLLRV